MKMKLSRITAAVALATGMMGYIGSALAGDADPVQYTASVLVHSNNTCGVYTDVPAGSDAIFSATWDSAMNTDTPPVRESTLTATSNAEPAKITVTTDPGVKCTLSGMHIETYGQAGIEQAPDSNIAYRKQIEDGTGTAVTGGFWRFIPTMASVKLYTTEASSTPVTTVAYKDAKGVLHNMNTTAQVSQGTAVQMGGLTGNSEPGVTLTNNYLTSTYAPMMMGAGNGLAVSYIQPYDAKGDADNTTAYQKVELGIGAVVAKDPEAADGKQNPDLANNGNLAQMPFTVVVSMG